MKPISTTAWEMSYSGDVFGFEPSSNGQYTFHIYSSKFLHVAFILNPFNLYF
ncbi:hypothetical protein O3M35_007456 [Rhynocoris fuscipes]|uniref:Uncharacterized protein n=1 Tax=Rhynocoris fuscipes TaxID=488301 RepID=A0AAW1DC61_9HEMI